MPIVIDFFEPQRIYVKFARLAVQSTRKSFLNMENTIQLQEVNFLISDD